MDLLSQITSNYHIDVAFSAWFMAQVLKVLTTFIATKKFVPERLYGAGGMPSAHSALVCSLTFSFARKMGYASPFFALSLVLAAIVMYDAMGVRRAAGEQAKVLNKIVFGWYADWADDEGVKETNEEMDDLMEGGKQLKEMVGHTPLQVLAGALVGILVALIIPVF